jgi:hypothetical protein
MRPRQSGSPKRTDTTPRDRGTTTTTVIEARGEEAVRLRRIWGPPQTRSTAQGMRGSGPPIAANLNQDASHNNKGRRRRRCVEVANVKKGTGTLLTSVMKTTVGF